MSKPETDRIGELLDRTRRIETKLCVVMEKMGVDPKNQKPTWTTGIIQIHSKDVRLRDIVSLIPDGWDKGVEIHHKGELVFSFYP